MKCLKQTFRRTLAHLIFSSSKKKLLIWNCKIEKCLTFHSTILPNEMQSFAVFIRNTWTTPSGFNLVNHILFVESVLLYFSLSRQLEWLVDFNLYALFFDLRWLRNPWPSLHQRNYMDHESLRSFSPSCYY